MSKEDFDTSNLETRLEQIAASLQQIEEILRDQSQPKFVDFVVLDDVKYALDNRGNLYEFINIHVDKKGDTCHRWQKIKLKLNAEE